jgi:hypothetical protein
MWHSGKETEKHHEVLCERLHHNWTTCGVCITRGVLIMRISPLILGAKYRRYLRTTTRLRGDDKSGILCQRVRGFVRAVRAVRNSQVFLMHCRDGIDKYSRNHGPVPTHPKSHSPIFCLGNISAKPQRIMFLGSS